uniref:KAT8 regulatory NSL complex subunit 2 isoform X1 n=1 Tax=Myxine glutinosa TaxID=7769 RepID=UPI0035900D46
MNRIRIHVLPPSRTRVSISTRVTTEVPTPCAYEVRPCARPRIDGYEFCLRHILHDRTAPYRQCSYVSSRNGKRCPNAAPRVDRKDGITSILHTSKSTGTSVKKGMYAFCGEHVRKAARAARQQRKKLTPAPTAENLLAELCSYPDVAVAGQSRSGSRNDLGLDSWSESDGEGTLVEQLWRADPDSEAESIDSDQEDPLKHAGVYTAEEVALITRNKLIRLQSLYIDQFKRLQHMMEERRHKFLHNRQEEEESAGSSHLVDEGGVTEEARRLRAMKRYRRRYGVEAILQEQLKVRRARTSEGHSNVGCSGQRGLQQCMSINDGVRCAMRALPLAKHCASHICQDGAQLLFQLCPGEPSAPCSQPVPAGLWEDRCPLHMRLLPIRYMPPPPDALGSATDTAATDSSDDGLLEPSGDSSSSRHIDVVGDISQMFSRGTEMEVGEVIEGTTQARDCDFSSLGIDKPGGYPEEPGED